MKETDDEIEGYIKRIQQFMLEKCGELDEEMKLFIRKNIEEFESKARKACLQEITNKE